MTDRLYYHDSFLYNFEAQVIESLERSGRHAIKLDRTAFYPTSGGQVHDTGKFVVDGRDVAATEIADEDDGSIIHFIAEPVASGRSVRGVIDSVRRRDNMQQHSGQHVLSAAFVRLFDIPTMSFHMGAESCTIDLGTKALSSEQIVQAERLANEVITEDRSVAIRFVPLEEARQMGLRKLPRKQTGDLRLIDISDFDLTACGGTHVRSTGQIGSILLRKVENVKQGVRVEFVCGLRAVDTARQDYDTLSEAAGLYSAHLRDVPEQIRKSLQETKTSTKERHKLLEELAELQAVHLLSHAMGSPRVITAIFPDRDAVFIKLVAQKLTAANTDVVVLIASGSGQPALVFAQSPGQKWNMGQLLKETLSQLGGRGGGTADMAQGGLPANATDLSQIEKVLQETAKRLV
ncbi:MAG TPA: DHHA1 domain-containing protein [Candidatus Angelobacter sp.]|jgi:alanyl-tRNA synthetase|nr:DHHA1 domain-containing protein [Candidatus Angelobacter sp.]